MPQSQTEVSSPCGAVVSSALVAIVDDDPRIQELLSAELADLNQQHLSFNSGEALLAELAQCSPKLIFLDVLMPGMGGMECLKQLRDKGYPGAVVMFSALNDAELQQQAEQAGANGWVLKAALFDDVETILRRYLTQS